MGTTEKEVKAIKDQTYELKNQRMEMQKQADAFKEISKLLQGLNELEKQKEITEEKRHSQLVDLYEKQNSRLFWQNRAMWAQVIAAVALVIVTGFLVNATIELRTATELSGFARPMLEGTFITQGNDYLRFNRNSDMEYTFWIFNLSQLPVNLEHDYPVLIDCSAIDPKLAEHQVAIAVIGFRENETSRIIYTENRYAKINIPKEVIEQNFSDGCELKVQYWPVEFISLKKDERIKLKEA